MYIKKNIYLLYESIKPQVMKRHLLLTFCSLLMVLAVKGQNYQTVNPDVISSFVDENNHVGFIRIDSTVYDNGLVFYPFAVNQWLGNQCFSPNAGSWAGSEIIIKDNGYNIFINHAQDSVKINTLAPEGDSWIAYGQTGQLHIVAAVVEHGVMEFQGLTDSVKVIAFQAYNSDGEPTEMEVNDMQVKISKNYGFVKTLSFYNFPEMNSWYDILTELTLAGLSEPETGVKNFYWFDVHDFQPGDVLHVLRNDGTWIGEEDGYFQITETRKVYEYLERNDYNDSIEYIYSLTQMVLKPWIDSIEVIEDTITEVIKPYPGFDKLPGEPIFEEHSQDNITTYEYFTMTAGEHLIKTFSNYWFESSGEDCWIFMHYDGVPLTTYYMKGLGGPYYPYHALFGSLLHQEPVYYEKGGESWGVPLDVTNVQDIQVVENIKIYPNPAKDVLTLNIGHAGSGSYTLRLYDTNSRLINTKELQPGDNVLNVSHLTPGLYFLIISNRQGIQEARKILVQ